MIANAAFSPLVAAALIGCGAMLLALAAPARRKRLAARVAMVAPAVAQSQAITDAAFETFSSGPRAEGAPSAELLVFVRLLRRLGLPTQNAAQTFRVMRGVAALLGAVTVFLMLRRAQAGPFSLLPLQVSLSGAGGALGWYGPLFIVRKRAAQRVKIVSAGLSEALELLVVCVEAGLALEDSLERVTKEIRPSQPELADELSMTAADLTVLPSRDQALNNLADRVGTPAMRAVVATLSQTLRYGTPLATALRAAASELRNDALMSLEERAGRLPTLMTIPLIVFFLPTIFIIVGGPAALRLLDIFSKAH